MSTSATTNGSDANSGTSGTANPVFIGTDNRCCFCLTLRTGSVIVGVVNALVSTLLFSWYATSPTIKSSWSHSTPFSDLDMSIVIVFVLQIVVDGILIAAAVKKQAAHTVPWLCTNSIVMGILLVLVTLLLFFGFSALALSYDEYVSILSLIGCLAGGHLFSCLVVFQFRKNLIEDAAIREAIQHVENGDLSGSSAPSAPPRAPSPPPTYEEVSKTSPPQLLAAAAAGVKQSEGSLPPPEYDAAVAFMKKQARGQDGYKSCGDDDDDDDETA